MLGTRQPNGDACHRYNFCLFRNRIEIKSNRIKIEFKSKVKIETEIKTESKSKSNRNETIKLRNEQKKSRNETIFFYLCFDKKNC